MTSKQRQALLLLAAIAIHEVTGCASQRALTVPELFDGIRVGMSCTEVETMLGRPVLRYATVMPPRLGEDEAWYLPPPDLDPIESPWGWGAILVVYSVDGRVASKELNPQWRESKKPLANKTQQPTGAPSGAGG
jgi:hypothetical protein